jgi:hypothetical protein
MYCTLWVTTVLGCLQSNTPFKPVSVLKIQLGKYWRWCGQRRRKPNCRVPKQLDKIDSDWVVKSVLQILIITSTHNGFIQLFNSWYNKNSDKAEDIQPNCLVWKEGNATVNAVCDENIDPFQPKNGTRKDTQEKILLQYRLTYLARSKLVSGLGTVLANDEL